LVKFYREYKYKAHNLVTWPSRTDSSKRGGPADQTNWDGSLGSSIQGCFGGNVCRNCHIKMDDLFAPL